MNGIYFESLAAAVDAAVKAAEDSHVLLARPSEVFSLVQDHLAYGASRRGDFEIQSVHGRPTSKFFHVVICRLDSGRYELNTYVL